MSETTTRPEAGPAASRGLTAVAAVLLVLAAVLAVLYFAKVRPDHRRDLQLARARTEALAAGRQAILDLDAISAPTLDKDLKRVEAVSTGKFKDLFTKSESTLRELYPKQKTASTGTVRSAAVVSYDTDTVTLLVASDRNVTDISNVKPVLQTSRWELVMEKHGGKWLMADLEPVP